MLEKLVLALVYGARRLKRYFQGHPIQVLTDYKLKNVLAKPELSGRLAKWAIELGEHSIEYKPRPAVKGQFLADFITEVLVGKVQECLLEQQTPIPSNESQQWTLFMDGASSGEGSGAGLKLINLDDQEFTYAIKQNFKSTNNEAKYEALLAGLRIARKLRVRFLEARVDSMLITGQVSGTYEAKNDVMASYLSQAKDLMQQFTSCKVVYIKRSENRPADALSKLASTSFEHMDRDVRIEVLDAPSIPQHQVLVIQTGTTSWMEPIRTYLSSGILPEDKTEARKVRHKALCYQVHDGTLFRKSFLGPLLRCVDAEDANYVIREIHEGICGLHAGPRMVVAKIMSTGYYWPGMHMDALKEIQKSDACQKTCTASITAPKQTHPSHRSMAFPDVGHRHHRTIPRGSRTSKVPISRYRLLHKVGGG
ncbi:uncharacterized protein LOC143610291 [Bidens hawaiensis]|uniref:uncharacterized protein LOC143610291 n=1 Tax=Bidens hawaiensis TaxID=980011 RepID=UPI00404BA322